MTTNYFIQFIYRSIQITGVKLVMASIAELENPEYEKTSFGMIPYKAASLIRRLHPVWIPLLNEHMRQHGYGCYFFLFFLPSM